MNPQIQNAINKSTEVAKEAARVSGQTFTPGAPITSQSLRSVQPFTLPPVPVSTKASGFIEETSAAAKMAAERQKQLDIASNTAQADLTASKEIGRAHV